MLNYSHFACAVINKAKKIHLCTIWTVISSTHRVYETLTVLPLASLCAVVRGDGQGTVLLRNTSSVSSRRAWGPQVERIESAQVTSEKVSISVSPEPVGLTPEVPSASFSSLSSFFSSCSFALLSSFSSFVCSYDCFTQIQYTLSLSHLPSSPFTCHLIICGGPKKSVGKIGIKK